MRKKWAAFLLIGAVVLGLFVVIINVPLSGPYVSRFLRFASLGQVILSVTVVNPNDHSGGGGSGGTSGGTSGGSGGSGAGAPIASALLPEKTPETTAIKGDLNGDGKVTLADFSILAYWYHRPLTDEAKASVDINGDGKVTLADFSILAYYWNR